MSEQKQFGELKWHAHWMPPEQDVNFPGDWEFFDNASCPSCIPVTIIETAELERLRAEVERLKTATVPEGWKLVPAKATIEMLDTWADKWPVCVFRDRKGHDPVLGWANVQKIYDDLLAAAPNPPSATDKPAETGES